MTILMTIIMFFISFLMLSAFGQREFIIRNRRGSLVSHFKKTYYKRYDNQNQQNQDANFKTLCYLHSG